MPASELFLQQPSLLPEIEVTFFVSICPSSPASEISPLRQNKHLQTFPRLVWPCCSPQEACCFSIGEHWMQQGGEDNRFPRGLLQCNLWKSSHLFPFQNPHTMGSSLVSRQILFTLWTTAGQDSYYSQGEWGGPSTGLHMRHWSLPGLCLLQCIWCDDFTLL